MILAEVTTLLNWVTENRIDQYVRIDALTDRILDLLEQTHLEDVVAPILIGDN